MPLAAVSTAFHEAGHAVAMFALGLGFDRISIVPDEEHESLGHVLPRPRRIVTHRDILVPAAREVVRDYIIVLLAGAEAQAKYEGRPVAEVVLEGGPTADYEYAQSHAENLEPATVTPALFGYLDARTHDLVEVHWFLIEALANELLRRRSISGVTANRLLRGAIQQTARGTEWDEKHWESLTPYGWRWLADQMGRFGPTSEPATEAVWSVSIPK